MNVFESVNGVKGNPIQGAVVQLLDKDGKAAARRIKTGDPAGTGIVIESGLNGGEQVVVDGLQSIRPGAPVRATAAAAANGRS